MSVVQKDELLGSITDQLTVKRMGLSLLKEIPKLPVFSGRGNDDTCASEVAS